MGDEISAELTARLRRVILRMSKQLNASATGEGLTPSQASALGVVAVRGPISLGELTRVERLNPTMASRVVGKLDGLGLVRRVPSSEDQRAVTLEITPAGAEASARVREQRGAVLTDCLLALSADERNDVLTALPALEALAEKLLEAV